MVVFDNVVNYKTNISSAIRFTNSSFLNHSSPVDPSNFNIAHLTRIYMLKKGVTLKWSKLCSEVGRTPSTIGHPWFHTQSR